MIDRSQLLFPFRSRTLLGAAAISLVLCALVPLLAAFCLLGGWIAYAAIWAVVIGSGIVALLGIGGGILALLGGGSDDARGFGCLSIIAGFLCAALHGYVKESWPRAATYAIEQCNGAASYLFVDTFLGRGLWFWSWSPLALALGVAAALLLAIGLLRCEGAAKYSLLRIGYTCPKCHQQRVPHFRCSNSKCKALVPDLAPTVHGILSVPCGYCGERLATIDLLGRLKLNKVCARVECQADLDDPSLGHVGEYHFAVVGAASSGKSNLMVAAIWQLEQQFARPNGFTIAFANAAEEAAYRARIRQFERGEAVQKTSAIHTFNLTVRRARGQPCRLYLYDAAGEDFAEEERLGRHVFHRFVDGILFVVDPFAEAEIRRGRPGGADPAALGAINPASQEASEILARLVNSLESTLNVRAGGVFPVPVAVALTKVDGLGLDGALGGIRDVTGSYLSLDAAVQDAVGASDRIRGFLVDSGLGNLVGILEARFPRAAYFGVSALGRVPDPTDRSPFQPRGAFAPLLWLGVRAQAFTDSLSIRLVGVNAVRILDRSLRGFQGPRARLVAWSLVACAAALLICCLWYGFALLTGSTPEARA